MNINCDIIHKTLGGKRAMYEFMLQEMIYEKKNCC